MCVLSSSSLDRCSVISDFETSKEFLKREKRCFWRLKPGHNRKKCHKTKPCFYCKCIHNSAICSNREILKTKQETKTGTPTSTNYASNVLENPVNKKQVRTKVLFDQGLKRSYVTQRIMNILDFYFYICE